MTHTSRKERICVYSCILTYYSSPTSVPIAEKHGPLTDPCAPKLRWGRLMQRKGQTPGPLTRLLVVYHEGKPTRFPLMFAECGLPPLIAMLMRSHYDPKWSDQYVLRRWQKQKCCYHYLKALCSKAAFQFQALGMWSWKGTADMSPTSQWQCSHSPANWKKGASLWVRRTYPNSIRQ